MTIQGWTEKLCWSCYPVEHGHMRGHMISVTNYEHFIRGWEI